MARNTKPEALETEAVEDVSTPVESAEVVEAVEAETPAEAPAEEAEPEIDLGPFTTAFDAAIENTDESTGVVPEARIAEVRTQYQALSGIKAKNKAKELVAERMGTWLRELNGVLAKAAMQITEESLVAGKSSTPKPAADPAEAFVAQVATLTLALFVAQSQVPEGVDGEAAKAKATELATEAFAEAVEVAGSEEKTTESALINAALRLAKGKVRKASAPRAASTGERRDIGEHIKQAFAGVEAGTFLSVADIRKFESSEYPSTSDRPSPGAISNRLEPKSGKPTTVPGITVVKRDGKLGAVKAGEVTAEA